MKKRSSQTEVSILTPEPQPAAPVQPVGFHDVRRIFIGGGLASSLLVMIIAVYQWLPGPLPLMMSLGIAVILSGVVAFVFCNTDQRGAFLRGALIWALIGLPTTAWALPAVRGFAVETVGGYLNHFARSAIFRDNSSHVRQRACVALGIDNQDGMAEEIIGHMYAHPQGAAACIGEVMAQDPPGGERLRSAFMSRWRGTLNQSAAAPVCAVSPHVFAVDDGQSALSMTQCAVQSRDPERATCCADALTDYFDGPSDYVQALGAPDRLSFAARLELFVAMVPHTFPDIDASRMDLRMLEAKLLYSRPVRQWVIALGCDLVLEVGSSDRLGNALNAIVSSQRCDEELAAGSRPRPANAWSQICAAWDDWDDPDDAEPTLCPAIDSQRAAEAVLIARSSVRDAAGMLQAAQTEADIRSGFDALSRRPADDSPEGLTHQFSRHMGNPNLPMEFSSSAQRRMIDTYMGNPQLILDHMKAVDEEDAEALDRIHAR